MSYQLREHTKNAPFFSYQRVLRFHDQYGDVVRLGPTFVSIANKDMLKQILVTEDFPKAKIYDAFQSEYTVTCLPQDY